MDPRVDISKSEKLYQILRKIYHVSNKNSLEVYLVGGSVRDLLIDRPVTDLDFVVLGDGIEFAEFFAAEYGIKKVVKYPRFGTALVPFQKFHLEFVGARAEEYEKHSRKPRVKNTDLKGDLSRRDFTINAMAMRIDDQGDDNIIDMFDSFSDLKAKTIRTPLEPERTFFDDPLRILRAIRFVAQLNFQIEERTLNAIKKMANRLSIISVERIAEEFRKLLISANPVEGIRLLDESGLLEYTIPELLQLKTVEEQDGHTHKDMFAHTLKVLENISSVSNDFGVRFAALLHDIGKPGVKKFSKEKGWTFHGHEKFGAEIAEEIVKRLRYGNDFAGQIKKLVLLHPRPAQLAKEEAGDSAYRRLIVDAGEDLESLLLLARADISTKFPEIKKEILGRMDGIEKRLEDVEQKDHLRNFICPVDGLEIIELLKIKPGPLVGEIKDGIKEAIIDGVMNNSKEDALEFIAKNKSRWLERD